MNQIELKILATIQKKHKITSANVAEMFGISRQAAHKRLRVMAGARQIVRIGKTNRAFYTLPTFVNKFISSVTTQFQSAGLKEHEVLDDVNASLPELLSLPENVRSIFTYTFSEMLNNAIEHSKSKFINVSVGIHDGVLQFEVKDCGVGVFRNVMEKYKLASEIEAVQEILKGKTTTAPKAHSGEGIFFTSKIADRFSLDSFGYGLIVDNTLPDIFIQSDNKKFTGTKVTFQINTLSDKHLIDLFRCYEGDEGGHGFDKTKINVKLYAYGTVHVSRSQARRVLVNLEKFKRVVLDFDQVPSVGQAFVDEVFRVFQTDHPDIAIETQNANEAVQFMIDRAKK